MRFFFLIAFLPSLAWAGSNDIYQCTNPDDTREYSIYPCKKGQVQLRFESDIPSPPTQTLPWKGSTVKLERHRSGSFFTTVKINGVPLRAIIDTGASGVAIAASAAKQLNIDTRKGQPGFSQTANGLTSTLYIILPTVELGGNSYPNIQGNILNRDMGYFDVLLGMSYLRNFEINTDGNYMTLRPK